MFNRGHLWGNCALSVKSMKFRTAIRLSFKDGSPTNVPPRGVVIDKMETRVILPTNIAKTTCNYKQHITTAVKPWKRSEKTV